MIDYRRSLVIQGKYSCISASAMQALCLCTYTGEPPQVTINCCLTKKRGILDSCCTYSTTSRECQIKIPHTQYFLKVQILVIPGS